MREDGATQAHERIVRNAWSHREAQKATVVQNSSRMILPFHLFRVLNDNSLLVRSFPISRLVSMQLNSTQDGIEAHHYKVDPLSLPLFLMFLVLSWTTNAQSAMKSALRGLEIPLHHL